MVDSGDPFLNLQPECLVAISKSTSNWETFCSFLKDLTNQILLVAIRI
jgi:hypothetical protein